MRALILAVAFVACNKINPPAEDKIPPWVLLLLAGCRPTFIAGMHQGCDLNLAGTVTTIAGPAQGANTQGDTDADGLAARFNAPYGMTSDGIYLYDADLSGNKIRRMDISTLTVTTIAGPAQGSNSTGDVEGTGTAARFNNPAGLTSDGTNLYVVDSLNHKVKKIVIASGAVSILAGPAAGSATTGDTDGTGNGARFSSPIHLTNDGTNLYVSDTGNHKIRKIVIATGVVTTFAGAPQGSSVSGDTDGTGTAARFNMPQGITTDGTNLYVCDQNNHKIRKIVIATGVVTTIAGPAQGTTTLGDTDGTGNAARFRTPFNVTTDGTNLYISEVTGHKIRKVVIATGVVTTLAGPGPGGGQPTGDIDGTGTTVRFSSPAEMTIIGRRLYLAGGQLHKIRLME